MPQGSPQPAHYEEFDEDAGTVKPNTRREARRKKTAAGPPPRSLDRFHRPRASDAASDSGYSSHTGSEHGGKDATSARAMPPPPRTSAGHHTTRNKPIIHASWAPSSPSKEERSTSTSRRDPTVRRDSNQATEAEAPRRSSLQNNQQRHAAYLAQYQQQLAQYPPHPGQYAHMAAPYAVPTSQHQGRVQLQPSSRQARPLTFEGYSQLVSANPHWQSAHDPTYHAWAQRMAAQEQYRRQQQAAAIYGTSLPSQFMGMYSQLSPTQPSPTSPQSPGGFNYTVRPPLSARTMATNTSTGAYAGLMQSNSTRMPSARTMTGAFVASSGSESGSSASEISEYETTRRRSRQRDSRLMSSSSSRRPSIKRQSYTEPVLPTIRQSQEQYRPYHQSDHVFEYFSSSDAVDSDRTARAVVGQPRSNYTGSSKPNSRRPSISTASSGHTRTTGQTSLSGYDRSFVARSSGRPVEYFAKEEQPNIRRMRKLHLEEQSRLDDQCCREKDAEAYQDQIRGQKLQQGTVEEIRRHERRKSNSHVSHSRKISYAGSKADGSILEGIKIEAGGTVLHLFGEDPVQIRPSEDGTRAHVIIGAAPASSRGDSTYHSGSKSSSSRVGRSRVGSDMGGRRRRDEGIKEEDRYVPPL